MLRLENEAPKSKGSERIHRHLKITGTLGGITVLDDSACTPEEIASALSGAAEIPHQRMWIVFQPFTFSRLRDFCGEFAELLAGAGKVILTDIYAGGEAFTTEIHSEHLQKKITELGGECYCFSTFDEIEIFLLENCTNGDLLITMGAGDVHKIGENLLGI